jgi:hypothetical protein
MLSCVRGYLEMDVSSNIWKSKIILIFIINSESQIARGHSLYSPLLGPGLFFSFVIIFTQLVGLIGRVISPSQGRCLYIGQHKHRKNANTDIHVLSGIRTHDPRVRASEDSSCLRPRVHRDRRPGGHNLRKLKKNKKLCNCKYSIVISERSCILLVIFHIKDIIRIW